MEFHNYEYSTSSKTKARKREDSSSRLKQKQIAELATCSKCNKLRDDIIIFQGCS